MDKEQLLNAYREAVNGMRQGNFKVTLPEVSNKESPLALLGQELAQLGRALDQRFEKIGKIQKITQDFSSGTFAHGVLDRVHESFSQLIPYDRIGCALITEDRRHVEHFWAKSNYSERQHRIRANYRAKLEGSSLETIIATGEPRILNDLEAYLESHPQSFSTRSIIAEGIRSSLTCPLIAEGRPLGFLFFSSRERNAYQSSDQVTFMEIASHLSIAIERSKLHKQTHDLNQELQRAQAKLIDIAERDEMTGLLSRRGFKNRFVTKERMHDFGMYFVDADRFKSVNDNYGHVAGDRVLKSWAATLEGLASDNDFVVRLGGEEFAIVRSWYGWHEAYTFGETLKKALSNTVIDVNGYSVRRTCSIGFSQLEKDADVSSSMRIADIVLNEAKKSGRNKVLGADDQLLADLKKQGRFITHEQIQNALKCDEFKYYVQPIWNVKSNTLEGFEALMRWETSAGEVIPPIRFIDVLEEVFKEPEYMAFNKEMRKKVFDALGDFPAAYISFNFKLEQLAFEGAASVILDHFEEIKDTPERKIVIELSEVAIKDRVDQSVLREELNILSDAGMYIALDDFGVASSNIYRIQEYPIHIIKFDKSLIEAIEHSTKNVLMMQSLSQMTQTLQIKSIVEGIETLAQSNLLKSVGLFSHQGYLYAKPMKLEEISDKQKWRNLDGAN